MSGDGKQNSLSYSQDRLSLLNIVILGRVGVGKTVLRSLYAAQHQPDQKTPPTHKIDFNQYAISLHERSISLLLWEIAGNVSEEDVFIRYLLNADGIIVVFDYKDSKAFEYISDKIELFCKYTSKRSPSILIVQNNCYVEDNDAVTRHKHLISRLTNLYQSSINIHDELLEKPTSVEVQEMFRSYFSNVLTEKINHVNNLPKALFEKYVNQTAYLMSFDEDYGPIIVAKSPVPDILQYHQKELSHAVRLYAILDYEDLITNGFRLGMAPWPHEDATMYYMSFVIDNDNTRGGYDMFILGISIPDDLITLLGSYHQLIEGYLLSAMNRISSILIDFEAEVEISNQVLEISHNVDQQGLMIEPLDQLREDVSGLISHLLGE